MVFRSTLVKGPEGRYRCWKSASHVAQSGAGRRARGSGALNGAWGSEIDAAAAVLRWAAGCDDPWPWIAHAGLQQVNRQAGIKGRKPFTGRLAD